MMSKWTLIRKLRRRYGFGQIVPLAGWIDIPRLCKGIRTVIPTVTVGIRGRELLGSIGLRQRFVLYQVE